MDEDIVDRLRTRADIRLQISTRKSVQEGKPDRLSALLYEAANTIDNLRSANRSFASALIRKDVTEHDGASITTSGAAYDD